MNCTESDDVRRIRYLLAGDRSEQDEGLVLIDQLLKRRMIAWLKRRIGYLDPDALDNAWTDMLLAVLKLTRAGKYDASRPLLPWLCHLLHRRMVDQVRRKRTRRDILADLAAAKRAETRRPPEVSAGAEELRELLALIHATIAQMPRQQKRVLTVFIEHYPDSARRETLTSLVSAASGRRETAPSVKHALQDGRVKLRIALGSEGY